MIERLYPDQRYDSIYKIDLRDLKSRGIDGIITDLDNTLLPWHSEDVPPSLPDWLKKVKEAGFKICVLSNAGVHRAERMGKRLGVPVMAPALKPRLAAFRKGMKVLGLKPNEIAVVGDQIFMDILGGNRAGMYTVLVKPISKHEFWPTRLVRLMERVVLLRFESKNADNIKSSG